jgi:hypothetical protein
MMKKAICTSCLTVLVLLFNNYKATAQCSENGSWFSCYSFSNDGYAETNSADWYADGTLYYVTVYLEANVANDGYAYTEITTSDYYRYDMITEGLFQDSFTAPGQVGQLLRLYTAARDGEAEIMASW